jgi:hypothetical protein
MVCRQFISFLPTVAWELHHSAVRRAIVKSACGPPAGTQILTRCGPWLTLRFYPRSQVAGAGSPRVFVSLDCLPIAEGVLPSPPLQGPGRNRGSGNAPTLCEWCGDRQCLANFQLWVLSTIMMLALVIVGVKLPG